MSGPPNKKGSPVTKRPQNELGIGGSYGSSSTNKGREILRLLLNPLGLAQSSFQENRKGRVLGLYVKRPGLDTK